MKIKFAVVITILFVILVVAEGRRCRYLLTGVECGKQCCGKKDNMLCLPSCENVTCSDSEDCGESCCKNGKCGASNGSPCDDTFTTIITVIVVFGFIAIIIVAVFFLVRYLRRRSSNPGIIISVNQQARQ